MILLLLKQANDLNKFLFSYYFRFEIFNRKKHSNDLLIDDVAIWQHKYKIYPVFIIADDDIKVNRAVNNWYIVVQFYSVIIKLGGRNFYFFMMPVMLVTF